MQMPLYEMTENRFQPIPETSFAQKQLRERQDLQRLLKQEISVLSSDLLVIAEEFGDWDESSRRIDLLAVDKQANLVVIELKRTSDGGHMELQAIRYAAMVSTMTFAQACKAFEKYLADNGIELDASDRLLEFLGWVAPNEEDFGRDVRIVLASADFSKEVTTAVIWLNERGLDIKCVRLALHDFDGRTIVDIQQVIPLPEAESFQVRVKEKASATRSARSSASLIQMRERLRRLPERETERLRALDDLLRSKGFLLQENTDGFAVYSSSPKRSLYVSVYIADARWGVRRHQIRAPENLFTLIESGEASELLADMRYSLLEKKRQDGGVMFEIDLVCDESAKLEVLADLIVQVLGYREPETFEPHQS